MKAPSDLSLIRDHAPCERLPGIRPEILTAKIRAIRDLEFPALSAQVEARPELLNLLWFVQDMSHQPGGLEKFMREFLLEFPDQLCTRPMWAHGWPRIEAYTFDECSAIWEKLPGWCRRLELENETLTGDDLVAIAATKPRLAERLASTLTPAYLWAACAEAALDQLPALLASLCNEASKGFDSLDHEYPWMNYEFKRLEGVWFFHGLLDALFVMMDRHAKRARASIADTEAVRLAFAELDYGVSRRATPFIASESRHGKTKIATTNCRMWPGERRLVTVPASPRERDFLIAHAEALHYSYTERTPLPKLRDNIQAIARDSGLFLLYDEAHFLLPATYTKNTAPRRLNWVRDYVLDRGRGAALFATPQSYGDNFRKFAAETHYRMEQWIGRIEKPLILPASLTRLDVLAVARLEFPSIPDLFLEEIAAEALGTDCPNHTLTSVAKRALAFAQQDQLQAPTAEHVRRAIDLWQSRPSLEELENPRAVEKMLAGKPQPKRREPDPAAPKDATLHAARSGSAPRLPARGGSTISQPDPGDPRLARNSPSAAALVPA